jgi:hypothetical protein
MGHNISPMTSARHRIMNRLTSNARRRLALAATVAVLALAGCAELQPVQTAQTLYGASTETVRATFGTPTDTFTLKDGATRWIYSKQPLGYYIYAATFDTAGKLVDFRQTLTLEDIYSAQVDVWTKRDIEERYGQPREPKSYFPLMRREVWSYRFRQNDLLPSLFNCYFDDQGVLRQVQITLDPLGGDSDHR